MPRGFGLGDRAGQGGWGVGVCSGWARGLRALRLQLQPRSARDPGRRRGTPLLPPELPGGHRLLGAGEGLNVLAGRPAAGGDRHLHEAPRPGRAPGTRGWASAVTSQYGVFYPSRGADGPGKTPGSPTGLAILPSPSARVYP